MRLLAFRKRLYPDGLKGEEIPISAQVVSIVDVYDALTSERCYKKAFEHDTAIQMILDGQSLKTELSLSLSLCGASFFIASVTFA